MPSADLRKQIMRRMMNLYRANIALVFFVWIASLPIDLFAEVEIIPVSIAATETASATGISSATGAACATEVACGSKCASCTEPLELTLENLFHKEKLYGKTPSSVAWSFDGSYLAYCWNVYDATGSDVWLYDPKTGQTRQLTNVERFAPFDPEAQKIADAAKNEAAQKKKEAETDKEKSDGPKKDNQKSDDQKSEKKDEKIPDYAGVASFVWSETSPEMIVSYKNDLYRLDVPKNTIQRLTKTKEEELRFLYTKKGDGYIFWRGSSMIRVYFGDSYIEEIFPNIPEGQNVDQLILSPDQEWLAIAASKSTGGETPARKVGYVSYRDRFAKWQEHDRPLAEDKESADREQWIYLQKVNGRIHSGTENIATEVFHHPGGEQKLRITTPKWSEKSDKIVFRTYDPKTEEIGISIARIDSTDKAMLVHHARNSGYVRSPEWIQPEFTMDGEKIVAVFEDSGFRQPWLIDPIYQGKIPVARGNFDAAPIDYDQDGKTLFVLANKEHPARKDLYAVDLATGAMTRITQKDGIYTNPVFSEDGKRFAALFTNWDQPVELAAGEVPSTSEAILTQSHSEELAQLNQLKPQLFSYPNSMKQTINGMVFLPPNLTKEDKPPIMVYTYGGPLGTDSMVKYGGFGTYNYRFPMYMAKRHGYIAAVIDPRGSSNYGALFENASWQQPGKPQVDDLAEGVNYLVKEFGGDPQRVAIYGWSFGGFVTQMALYTKPDVFTVGMAGAGPTEWENYYGSYTSATISKSQENQPDQQKFSLLPLAKNLKGRLMLLHGIEDTNVLFQDTVKVYQALVKAGKGQQVELVLDTTGDHHMNGDMKYNDIFWFFEDFLMRTLGGGYKNLSENKPASASSCRDNHEAGLGNDCKFNTDWQPKEDDKTPWWQVDLQEPHHLTGTEIFWQSNEAEIQYKVEGSQNGQEWITLADWTKNKEKDRSQRQYFEKESIRYVRVAVTGAKEGTALGITNFMAFGR